MIRKSALAAAVTLLTLPGCAGGLALSQDAATASRVFLTAEQIAQLRAGCQAVAPALVAATAPGMPATVSQTAIYPGAYCQELLAGTIPATTDASTPAWLDRTLAVLSIAARVAGVVLPLIL